MDHTMKCRPKVSGKPPKPKSLGGNSHGWESQNNHTIKGYESKSSALSTMD